jgi:hypothetical protein
MKSLNNTRQEDNKSICDGFGCFNETTHHLDEEIGDMGKILLDLCDDCVLKFREQ